MDRIPNSLYSRCNTFGMFLYIFDLENRVLADLLILCVLVNQPYVITTQLLRHLTVTNQEVERDFNLAPLLTQLDDLTKKMK